MAGQPFAQDKATLSSLAFSDYQLWENPFLRDPNRDGCKYYRSILFHASYTFKVISIRTLLRRSHIFLADDGDTSEWTEVSVVKCLNTYAKDFFDIRMIIVDKTHVQTLAGGYEIRRKDWAEVTHRFPSFSPEYWHARTVYIVRRVPFQPHGLTAPHRRTSPSHSAPQLEYANYYAPSC
jgi:hypothetical protein